MLIPSSIRLFINYTTHDVIFLVSVVPSVFFLGSIGIRLHGTLLTKDLFHYKFNP